MRPYLLLTPGPLTTSESVKTAMMTDWCTWDEDYNVHIVEEIRKGLVQLATRKTDEYTSILMQGSGTYCVEATLGSVITPKHKLLILSNGAYGERMGNIAEYHGMNYDMLAFDETEQVSVEYVDDYLAHNAEITHVAVVHCETTTGILNPLKEIAHMVKMHGKKLIVDAMSSFGGVPLDVEVPFCFYTLHGTLFLPVSCSFRSFVDTHHKIDREYSLRVITESSEHFHSLYFTIADSTHESTCFVS